MVKFVVFFIALISADSALAQSSPSAAKSHNAKSDNATPARAEKPGAEPTNVSEVPRNVQKWIGGAVDDILTGADKAVNPNGEKR